MLLVDQRNPAEVVELGPRVLWDIVSETESVEATRHYKDCPVPEEQQDPQLGCEFCYYGPVDDIYQLLHRRMGQSRPHLGDPWYF